MRRQLQILVGLIVLSISVNAQVVNEFLVAKTDLNAQYSLWDGKLTKLMGYTRLLSAPINLPAPTLIFTEGDSIHLDLRNMSQNAPHTIHLHGLDVDQQNDGVPSLSWQVYHNQTGTYKFQAPHPGTYIYHCHVTTAIHLQGGMYGMIIVKPLSGNNVTWDGGYSYDKEYAWMLSELDSVWHQDSLFNHNYDTLNPMMPVEVPDYNPQYFLINGKSEQQLNDTNISINAKANATVYLRLAAIGYYGNRIVFPPALNAQVVSTDGRPLPAPINLDTLELFPGERYGVLFNPTTEFTDSILVQYKNMNNHGYYSTQKVPVDIDGFVGIKDHDLNLEVLLYPNPTNGAINILADAFELGNIAITVTNSLGQSIKQMRVMKEGASPIPLDLKGLTKGIYFIKLEQNNQSKTIKTIIN